MAGDQPSYAETIEGHERWKDGTCACGWGRNLHDTSGYEDHLAGLGDAVRPVVSLRDQLRAFSKSDYCVNEKAPPSYERMWRLFVRWPDGSSQTYWGDDSESGYERVYRDALRDARRLGFDGPSDG